MSDIVTVVGQQTVVKGSLRGDEDLTVFGRIEGGVNLTKTLIVEGSGVVVADIEVRDAIISGVVVGNISASNSVQITEEGRMVGDISSPRVIIVDGASFRGHVDMGDLGATLPADRPAVPAVRTQPRSVSAPPRPERAAPRRRGTVTSAKRETPRKGEQPPPSKPASARKPAAKKSRAPAPPAKPKKKSARKPPKPPKMPAGRRKVKRR